MDISKRHFLQQLGVVTAGASLIPLAQASLSLKPERHEGSEKQRYAMLIDLRRCIGCQSCTVSCTIEKPDPAGGFPYHGEPVSGEARRQRRGDQRVAAAFV